MKNATLALNEWFEKTAWVQEQIASFPITALGKHRADIMREEIERLRNFRAKDTARLDFFIGRRVTWYAPKERGRRPGGNGIMCFDNEGRRQEIEAPTLRDALDVGIDLYGGKP